MIGAAKRRKERFQRHEHRASRRRHELLAYDLQGIGHAHRADARIYHRKPRLPGTGPVHRPLHERADPTQHRCGGGLEERNRERVQIPAERIDDKNMRGEQHRATQQYQIRQGDGSESIGDAQQIETEYREHDAHYDIGVDASAQHHEWPATAP